MFAELAKGASTMAYAVLLLRAHLRKSARMVLWDKDRVIAET